jgi:methylated-DNA-[protein]-cysteine S-methyltransferase
MDVDLFASELGWIAMLGDDGRLARLLFGFPAERDACEAVERMDVTFRRTRPWDRMLRKRLVDFARGAPHQFDDVELDLEPYGDFARKVLSACQRIPWGGTCTYGELAAQSGAPGAARAVGNVMASNRFPLVVPCHRVVAANGRLGGFSAPQGLAMKRRLLHLESRQAPLALVG